jgi:putative endonuclease
MNMHYVYALKSLNNHDLYIGSSDNLRTRFNAHNKGKVKSTKSQRPWKLVYYEAYKSKKDSTKRECQLKMHAVKNELKRRLKNSLEI